MSKQIKSYAEKHKFGFLDKSKKTKKVSIKKPKTTQRLKQFKGCYIKFNTVSLDFSSRSVPFIFMDEENKDPFSGPCFYNTDSSNFNIIEELEYLSIQLYNKIDIEKFINENEDHISRYVSLDNFINLTNNGEMDYNIFNSRYNTRTNHIIDGRVKLIYTDATPLTKDVLLDFLIGKIHAYIDYYLKYDPEDPYNMFRYYMDSEAINQSKTMLEILNILVPLNINKMIDLYKSFRHISNNLTLRDLCFFIYGIKGLQLFDTLQILGIDTCSFEFWNNIRDGILLESTTNLNTPEPLPEIEFKF